MAGYLCPMPNGIISLLATNSRCMTASAPVCVYRLLCCPCSPRALPWAGGSLPLSGAYLSERLLLIGIADVRVRYTRIANLAKR